MNRGLAMLLHLALSASLAFYGYGAMAGAHRSGATFSMVICSDGVGKTIEIGPDGKPVDPSDAWCACLDCGVATVSALPPAPGGAPSCRSASRRARGGFRRGPRNEPGNFVRPMPRGPPGRALGTSHARGIHARMTLPAGSTQDRDPSDMRRCGRSSK